VFACINQATTMTTDFATDMRAYAEAGFEAVELWLPKLEDFLAQGHSLDEAERLLRQLGLAAVAACAQGDVLLSRAQEREKVLASLRKRLGLARALGAETFVVYSESPAHVEEADYELAAANLAEACAQAAPLGITIGLEFIKGSRLVGCLPTAQMLVRKVGRPNLGIVLDTFHFYAGVSKMEDLEQCDCSALALVHVNDVRAKPRELWTDADRVLPGQGVLPLSEILGLIKGKGYQGYCSLELFSRELWEQDPFAAARAAQEALAALLASLGC